MINQLDHRFKNLLKNNCNHLGFWAAKFIHENGGIITHIIERNSAIFKTDGIDIKDAKAFFIKNKTFNGYKNAEIVETKDP